MFRGFTATAARDAPYAGMYMAFYEKGKDVLSESSSLTSSYQSFIQLMDRMHFRPKHTQVGTGTAERNDPHCVGNVGSDDGDTSHKPGGHCQSQSVCKGPNRCRKLLSLVLSPISDPDASAAQIKSYHSSGHDLDLARTRVCGILCRLDVTHIEKGGFQCDRVDGL